MYIPLWHLDAVGNSGALVGLILTTLGIRSGGVHSISLAVSVGKCIYHEKQRYPQSKVVSNEAKLLGQRESWNTLNVKYDDG